MSPPAKSAMRSAWKFALAGLTTASIGLCAAVAAPPLPPVASYFFTGSGCADSATLSAETDKLIVTMPDFMAEIRPEQENCELHVSLELGRPNMKLVIVAVTREGVLETRGGVNVTTSTRVFWTSLAENTFTERQRYVFSEEEAESQDFREAVEVPEAFASRCGGLGPLNINWRVYMSGSSEASFGTLQGQTMTVDFAWIPCDE